MQIFLTYDVELFFGKPTGTIDKCIVEPVQQLRDLAQRTGIKMVFFIDVGHWKKLQEYGPKTKEGIVEMAKFESTVKGLVTDGHDCQLHIHPHWEDTIRENDQWVMKTDRYKLDDFSDEEIEAIVVEYKELLENLTGKPVTSYRAGGWCLQPFDRVKSVFEKVGLTLDSTVFPGGKFTAGNYYYDFTNSPEKSKWKFSNDLIVEDEEGPFWEYPISNYKYSPLFFWRLFALGRINPQDHKPIGDGYPMSSPGLRKKMLTKGMNLSASSDGYFVTKLDQVLKKNQAKGYNEMVVLGHPKANTNFALKELEQFINRHKNKHQFLTFADLQLS